MSAARLLRRPLALLPLLALPACAAIDRASLKTATKGPMASSDLAASCAMGEALGGLLAPPPGAKHGLFRTAVLTSLSSAMCKEAEAWEAELEVEKALYEGRATALEDARIQERRAHAVAAERYLAAWDGLTSLYGPQGEASDWSCPTLKQERDQLVYLLGVNAGMLAVTHEGLSDHAADVPLDIPQRATRAAACLDNTAWWGVPEALQGAVWSSFPAMAPQGREPWRILDASSAMGFEKGVRLAPATAVFAAASAGDEARLRSGIKAYAEGVTAWRSAHEGQLGDPAWNMLNAYATSMVLHESDKLWIRAKGHRTPMGALGTFPAPPGVVNDEATWEMAPADDPPTGTP